MRPPKAPKLPRKLFVPPESYFDFVCDCTAVTEIQFRKPALWTASFQDRRCKGCDSMWQFRVRNTMRGLAVTHRLLVGTRKLADALEKKKKEKLAAIPQKKAPMFFTPPERKQ